MRDGIVPNSTILPVSAQILAHMDEYDATLELLSKLIVQSGPVFTLKHAWWIWMRSNHSSWVIIRMVPG